MPKFELDTTNSVDPDVPTVKVDYEGACVVSLKVLSRGPSSIPSVLPLWYFSKVTVQCHRKHREK